MDANVTSSRSSRSSKRPWTGGAFLGSAFFVWMAGLRVIDPREIGWLMRLDWQVHFLGWHLFRQESWQVPPGRLISEFFPVGTSIAYTDSLPLLALALKPWHTWLPPDFQYFGIWLLICFALQGACGALLIGCWTDSIIVRLLGATIFVLSPVLLDRVGHPALCSHWLILVGFWLYFRRWSGGTEARIAAWTILVLTASLVHPYLLAMTMALTLAAAARYLLVDHAYRAVDAFAHLATTAAASAAGAWTAGLFVVGSTARSEGGLGFYSMNLLGPIAANGWSAILGSVPVLEGQAYEGYNYLGAGVLALIVLAGYEAWRRPPRRHTVMRFAPLCTVCAVLALISLSNRITVGPYVVGELWLPDAAERWLMMFRATGRFFWPAGYLLITVAIAIIASRFRPSWAVAVLVCAITLQAFDVHRRFVSNRTVRSDPAWYAWSDPSADPFWAAVAPSRRHIVLIPPAACGSEAAPYEPLAFVAGRFHLTINTGFAARIDRAALARACEAQVATFANGVVDDDTIYIVAPADNRFVTAMSQLDCRDVRGALACVTARGRAP